MNRFLRRNKHEVTNWENPQRQQFQQPPELLQQQRSHSQQVPHRSSKKQTAPVIHDDIEEREQ